MLALAIFSIGYLDGILQWIYGLGSDSFLESSDFDIKEAEAWLKTFLFSIQLMLRPWSNTAILLLIEVFILSIGAYFLILRNKYLVSIFVAMIVAVCIHLIYLGYSGFKDGQIYVTNLKNQEKNKQMIVQEDEEEDYEEEYHNNNRANNISSITFLLMLIINSYAAYLSWECNSNKEYPLVLKVVFSFFAFIFGSIYLLYYILFRFDECNKF
jgi:cell division protein FtsL